MKETIIKIILINLFIYLFISYVCWDLKWFKEIPNMKEEDRFFTFLLYVLFILFTYLMTEIFSLKSK